MADEIPGLSPTDFAAFNQTVLQNDPYGIVGRSIASWQPDTTTWSPGTTAATAFGKAFLSGILNNYARQNAADQINSVVSVLPQLKSSPIGVVVPEGVDQDAFAALKGTAILKKSAADQVRENSLAEMIQKVRIAGLTKKAEVLGENEAYQQMGEGAEKIPGSPAYEAKQDDLKLQNDLFGVERNLANDFQKVASDYKYKEQGLKALTKAYLDPAGTSDYELIRRAAQSVEPGLAVRTDDEKSLRGAASALGMSFEAVKAAVTGDTKLTSAVRAGIMRVAQRSFDATIDDFNTLRDNFITRAKAAKVSSEAVVPWGAAVPFAQAYPGLDISEGTTPAPTVNAIKAPDGRNIVIVD